MEQKEKEIAAKEKVIKKKATEGKKVIEKEREY